MAANDGRWHHICFSWTNSDGSWQLYRDGNLSYFDTDLQTGYIINGNGIVTVGQEQELPCGHASNFDVPQSFQGSMANLNLWSSVLSAEKIQKMSQTCSRGKGDVLKWSDFQDNLKGDTKVVVPSPCVPYQA